MCIYIYYMPLCYLTRLYISMKSKHFSHAFNNTAMAPWLQEHVKTKKSDYKALIQVSIIDFKNWIKIAGIMGWNLPSISQNNFHHVFPPFQPLPPQKTPPSQHPQLPLVPVAPQRPLVAQANGSARLCDFRDLASAQASRSATARFD